MGVGVSFGEAFSKAQLSAGGSRRRDPIVIKGSVRAGETHGPEVIEEKEAGRHLPEGDPHESDCPGRRMEIRKASCAIFLVSPLRAKQAQSF